MTRVIPSRWYALAASSLLLVHAVCPILLSSNLKASNLFQFAAPCLAIVFCCSTSRKASDLYTRNLWRLLASAFALWSTAQGYFTAVLLLTGRPLEYPSAADALWLAFALPILLIVVQHRSRATSEWISWLDAGQAFLLFSLLGVLVFSREAGLVITQAYDVQGAALILLCGLRFSLTTGPDRVFFRNLGLYLLTYSALSSLDYRLEAHGWSPGGSVDLCWTIPPVFFILLSLWSNRAVTKLSKRDRAVAGAEPSNNLYGISALGLFLVSLLIGVFLHQRKPELGYAYIGIASLLFAARMIYREGQVFRAHRTLREACIRDSLTGLPNRTWLIDISINALQAGDQIILCNIDRFKLINDSFGRSFADDVLVAIAKCLSQAKGVRQAFRVGGDEFAVVLERNCADLEKVEAGLLAAVRQPMFFNERRMAVTITGGYATITSDQDVVQTLQQADAAMFHGKRHGSDQIVRFASEMLRDAASELAFESALKVAVAAGEIRNYYQPIYCTDTKRIVGFEALARWIRDGNVVAPPCDFIPVAEETWMILELGRKLLSQACEDVARLRAEAGQLLWISVNVSGKQLKDPALVEHLQAEILRFGIPTSALKLEITESVLLDDFTHVTRVLEELRTLGINIALDDFGTGYSSLSYLAALPFDVLKVDRSFVSNLTENTARFTITQAIVQLALSLGKQVVGEGVESFEEESHLASMGCTLLQGYRISKALPLDRVVELLLAASPNQPLSLFTPKALPTEG